MEYSKYQNDLFQFVQESENSAVVEAVAGSGKTVSIVEAANRLNGIAHRPLFLAFNKAIATELGTRLPPMFESRTMHSLGYRALLSGGSFHTENHKHRILLSQAKEEGKISWAEYKDKAQIRQLVQIAKSHLLGPDSPTIEFINLIKRYEISPDVMDDGRLVELAILMLEMSLNKSKMVDFDDMIYLPLMNEMKFPQHDFIFVDEAQDLNVSQHELLNRVLIDNGRLVVVGDSRQSIYGWRGADSASMSKLGFMFNCDMLPLSISYRCPKKIVERAKKIVPEIEAAPWAIEGEINYINQVTEKTFAPNDMILCRANAPLLGMAYKCIRMKIPAMIVGRNIGEGLVKLIRDFEADNTNQLEKKLGKWEEKRILHHIDRDEYRSADHVRDKANTIRVFLREMPGESVNKIINEIEGMFGDARKDFVNLSTVHRAKGLEADNVFIMENKPWHKSSKKGASWREQEERNIDYVAITRTKKTLNYLEKR